MLITLAIDCFSSDISKETMNCLYSYETNRNISFVLLTKKKKYEVGKDFHKAVNLLNASVLYDENEIQRPYITISPTDKLTDNAIEYIYNFYEINDYNVNIPAHILNKFILKNDDNLQTNQQAFYLEGDALNSNLNEEEHVDSFYINKIYSKSDNIVISISFDIDVDFSKNRIFMSDGRILYLPFENSDGCFLFLMPSEMKQISLYCLQKDNMLKKIHLRGLNNKYYMQCDDYYIYKTNDRAYLATSEEFEIIKPTLPEERMNVIFSFNETLAWYAPVTMVSLYLNHPDRYIDVYLIYNVLSDDVLKLMETTAKKYNQSIYFIKCTDPWNYDSFTRYGNSFECYFDLLPHEYLPKHIKRAIYLDVDLYVDANIEDMYFSDFDDAWVIGVLDVGNDLRLQSEPDNTLSIAAKGQGINSGCFVIDFNKLREHNVSIHDYWYILHQLKEINQPYFGDQALLNCFLLNKKVKYFPIQYNYMWLEHEPQNITTRDIDVSTVKVHHCGGNEYKPWSVRLNKYDVDFIKSKSYLLKAPISDRRVQINEGWWKYAKYAPNYQQLLADSVSYKHILSVIRFTDIEDAFSGNIL